MTTHESTAVLWAITTDLDSPRLIELPVLERRGRHGYVVRPPQGGRKRRLDVSSSTSVLPPDWGLRIVYVDRIKAAAGLRFIVDQVAAATAYHDATAPRAVPRAPSVALGKLGLQVGATIADVRAAFAEQARALHPDAGGSGDGAAMAALVAARDAALAECGA